MSLFGGECLILMNSLFISFALFSVGLSVELFSH